MRMHSFSQWIGAEVARQALIITLIRRQGASLLLSGGSGTGKSMLLSCVASMYPEDVSYLPLHLSPEMLYSGYTLDAEGEVRLSSGFLARLEGRILLVEQLPLHSRELLGQLMAYQEQLSEERRFTLIATTNPEGGAVPSALLDKFDLFVELHPTLDVALRKRILSEALRIPKPGEDMTFLSLVEAARQRFEGMQMGKELQKYVVQLCVDPLTLGHRGELALAHSALAWAAWQGKRHAERGDVDAVRQLALAHRWLETHPEYPAELPEDGAQAQDSSPNRQEEGESDGRKKDAEMTSGEVNPVPSAEEINNSLDASHAEDGQQDVPMIPPLQSPQKENPHTSIR